jgi:hypothetical protein
MKIRTFYTLQNDVYRVKIMTEDWSEGDQNLMSLFGEPEIDLGGSFTGPPAYDLGSNLVKILSESPFTQSFDSRDYVDAEDRANVWGAEIAVRITAAVAALRAMSDSYSREDVVTV